MCVPSCCCNCHQTVATSITLPYFICFLEAEEEPPPAMKWLDFALDFVFIADIVLAVDEPLRATRGPRWHLRMKTLDLVADERTAYTQGAKRATAR